MRKTLITYQQEEGEIVETGADEAPLAAAAALVEDVFY